MKKLSFVLIALLAVFVSCKKTPQVNIQYVDVEREVLNIGSTTANIQCDYEYIATLKSAKLYYGRTEDNMNSVTMRVVQSVLYAEISGLSTNTTYKYYYEFENGFNSMQSELKSFVTENSSSIVLPTIITADISGITNNSAICGGQVTDDGGGNVTARGICWGTDANPTLSDSHVAVGTGTGAFTVMMNGLEANTTYHVRAYATNEAGTAFGLDREFVTDGGGSGAPEGAINGLFTINANGDQVYFSQGNLQYQASTNIWRFAENQWDYVGGDWLGVIYGNVFVNGVHCANNMISPTYDGWIDLFCWGTSGYNHGAVCYQPWSTSEENSDYYAYGNPTCNLNDQTGQADWGYNAISNGGNTENSWRTLAIDEWHYILFTRTTTTGIRYAKANVCGINGVILFPDNWDSSMYSVNDSNISDVDYSSNTISNSNWVAIFETHGAVFLPVTGTRIYVMAHSFNEGCYWSATYRYYDAINILYFAATYLGTNIDNGHRHDAKSVRLVQNAH